MKYAKLVKIKVRETQTSVWPLAFIWQKVLLSKSLFQLSSHPLCSYVMEGTPLQGSPVAKPPNCAFLSHLLYISNLWRSYRIWELLKWYFLLALNIDRFFVISLHSNLTFLVPSEDICHQISSSSLRDCKSFFRKFLILWLFSWWGDILHTFYIPVSVVTIPDLWYVFAESHLQEKLTLHRQFHTL